MNTHITTLLINGQEYYIHEHYLKKCKFENCDLKLNHTDHIIGIFFEILYGNYESATKLKNVKDILSLVNIIEYFGFNPKDGFIEKLSENFEEFKKVDISDLDLIKNIHTNEELREMLLSQFIYFQLVKIEKIIMKYDDFYPKKERLNEDSENSIKQVIKACLEFHKIKCDNIAIEVNIWTNFDSHEFSYEINLKVDNIIKYGDNLDIGYLVGLITNLVIKQWNGDL